MKTEIIYEDKDLLVIRKPQGLATQSGQIGQMDVVSELKNYLAAKKENTYVGVIHRLDQPVEGLLVFAKNKTVAAGLSGQLTKGALNKHYYAVVCGDLPKSEDTLTDYLQKTKEQKAEVVDRSLPEAKEAVLHYLVIARQVMGREASCLDIQIDTGRFHQIRCQMAHAGFPLLGDQKYGTPKSLKTSTEQMVRYVALCAYRLEFLHPVTGKKMCFACKPSGKAFAGINFPK